MTLQIAWTGVLPPRPVVFPTLQQARFMAYDAIVGRRPRPLLLRRPLPQVMTPQDRIRGFNWTYWRKVQRPLTQELAGPQHVDALLGTGRAVHGQGERIGRRGERAADGRLGLPDRRPAQPDRERAHHVPRPAGRHHPGIRAAARPEQPDARVTVKDGAFTDTSPYGPHNARVYRLARR